MSDDGIPIWRHKPSGRIAYGDAVNWRNPDQWKRVRILTDAELAQAQAQAWDQGWDASVDAANKCDIAGGDPCGDCAICRPPNPYTERTDR